MNLHLKPLPRSKRLREVLEPLLAGRLIKQIAADLGISASTVHTHVQALYAYCGVESRAELAALWLGDAARSWDTDPGERTLKAQTAVEG